MLKYDNIGGAIWIAGEDMSSSKYEILDVSKLNSEIKDVLEYLLLNENTKCYSVSSWGVYPGGEYKDGLQAFMALLNLKDGRVKINYGKDPSINHEAPDSIVDRKHKKRISLKKDFLYLKGYIDNYRMELKEVFIYHTTDTKV